MPGARVKREVTMADGYIALLRGVNVGSSNRVAMADLRALMEGLGCTHVRTLLNSGNAVFSAARTTPQAAALRIEKALGSRLGVSSRVVVIGANELAEVVAGNPLASVAEDPSRLLVGILVDPADRVRLAEIVRTDWGAERIALGPARAVYMWMPGGVIKSRLNKAVGRVLKEGVTARNWATILKLKAMTEEGTP
jgi:uncharacterized protein (DUF1697 family)